VRKFKLGCNSALCERFASVQTSRLRSSQNMNTSTAKSAILDSIRQNLKASEPFDAVRAEHFHAEDFGEIKPFIAENKAVTFCENLTAIGANCKIVADLAEAKSEIENIISANNAKTIAISDSQIVVQIAERINADFIQNASTQELFDCDIGITSAQLGIAETGTLVIGSDKEFNRLTSLIPPVHICVLEASKIRHNLGETLSELEKDLSKSITFITGQSRTSDIELTLALGVHGPKELHVILVGD
jgi:L-lactate dehydrogenase complex protein LldG